MGPLICDLATTLWALVHRQKPNFSPLIASATGRRVIPAPAHWSGSLARRSLTQMRSSEYETHFQQEAALSRRRSDRSGNMLPAPFGFRSAPLRPRTMRRSLSEKKSQPAVASISSAPPPRHDGLAVGTRCLLPPIA